MPTFNITSPYPNENGNVSIQIIDKYGLPSTTVSESYTKYVPPEPDGESGTGDEIGNIPSGDNSSPQTPSESPEGTYTIDNTYSISHPGGSASYFGIVTSSVENNMNPRLPVSSDDPNIKEYVNEDGITPMEITFDDALNKTGSTVNGEWLPGNVIIGNNNQFDHGGEFGATIDTRGFYFAVISITCQQQTAECYVDLSLSSGENVRITGEDIGAALGTMVFVWLGNSNSMHISGSPAGGPNWTAQPIFNVVDSAASGNFIEKSSYMFGVPSNMGAVFVKNFIEEATTFLQGTEWGMQAGGRLGDLAFDNAYRGVVIDVENDSSFDMLVENMAGEPLGIEVWATPNKTEFLEWHDGPKSMSTVDYKIFEKCIFSSGLITNGRYTVSCGVQNVKYIRIKAYYKKSTASFQITTNALL